MHLPSTNPVTLPFASTAPPYSPGSPHKGVDFGWRAAGGQTDRTIRAPFTGKVTLVQNNGADGNAIYMYNGNQFHGLLHCASFAVANGATVKEGDVIATMGATGAADGIHLHWCVKVNGTFINPHSLLPAGGKGAGFAPGDDDDMAIPDADNYYGRMTKTMALLRGRDVNGVGFSREEFRNNFVGHTVLQMLEAMSDDPEANRAHDWMHIGYVATRDNWEGQIHTLSDQVKARDGVIAQLTMDAGKLQLQLKTLTEAVAIPAPLPAPDAPKIADTVVIDPVPAPPGSLNGITIPGLAGQPITAVKHPNRWQWLINVLALFTKHKAK